MKNKILIRLLSLFLVMVMMVPAGISRSSAEGTQNDPIIVVSLGDSYSSGEGIEKFYGQDKSPKEKVFDDNWIAHRSKNSWPARIEITTFDENGNEKISGPMRDSFVDVYSDDSAANRSGGVEWYFVAASGATTENYFKDQIQKVNRYDTLYEAHFYPQKWVFSQVEGTVDYVTLTLGGNDVHFADIITACALGSAYLDFNLAGKPLLTWLNEIIADIDTYDAQIKKTYKAIMADAPEAYIIVAGYPTLLNEDRNGVIIGKHEAELINMVTKLFNLHIRVICAELGDRVRFVDVATKFSGHEAYTDDNWISEIIFVPQGEDIDILHLGSRYSMHPNKTGAGVYAELVSAEINSIEEEKWEARKSNPPEPEPVTPETPPVIPEEPSPVIPEEPSPVIPEEPSPIIPEEPPPVIPEDPSPPVDTPAPVSGITGYHGDGEYNYVHADHEWDEWSDEDRLSLYFFSKYAPLSSWRNADLSSAEVVYFGPDWSVDFEGMFWNVGWIEDLSWTDDGACRLTYMPLDYGLGSVTVVLKDDWEFEDGYRDLHAATFMAFAESTPSFVIDPDCKFIDYSWNPSEPVTLDRETAKEEYFSSSSWCYTWLNVVIRNGKIVEIVIPYHP